MSWPTAVATDAELKILVNNVSTTLNGGINNSTTTVILTDASSFPTAGYVTIDSEAIAYTGKSTNTLTGVTRGADNTTAASHSDTAPVYHLFVADHHNKIKNEIIAIETSLNLTASRAIVTNGSGILAVATTTATEIGYVNGVTSAIQTQLDLKAPLASPTFTGTITMNTALNFGGTAGTDQRINMGGINTISREASGALTIATNASDIVLSPVGNVGVKNASPAQALDVTGAIKYSTNFVTPLTASRAMVTDGSSVLAASAVTSTELGYLSGVTSAIQTQLGANTPPGVIQMYGAASAPTGWLLCDGSAVSRSTYAALFAIVSTTFGTGDGSTTFTLPDMRGVFPKGAGTTARTLGKDANGTFYTGTLGTYLTDKFQGHYHNLQNYGSDTDAIPNTNSGTPGNSQLLRGSAASISQDLKVKAAITDTGNGTPRTGPTTEPQSLGLTYIIKT